MRLTKWKCCPMFVCSALLVLGAVPQRLQAQDAQAQSSTQYEMALFDEFLDAHAGLEAQLRANPSLATNPEFLEGHPELQRFLNQHPNLRADINKNPAEFLSQRQQFANSRRNRNPDLTRQEIATTDQFLDQHPNIDRELRRNPSLVNNADYLKAHPELQAFLSQHPNIKEEIAENPRFFMRQEGRFDARESARGAANPNPDLTRQQVGTTDQFLDSHPNIGQDLQRNPSLVNNADYLKAHPELQAFLSQHANIKQEIAENPRLFMRQEGRFDAQEMRQELATSDQFFDNHPNIDRDLQRNPSLVNNADYLKAHPELQAFLSQHPNIKQQIAENPRFFMRQEGRFDAQEKARVSTNPNPDLNNQELSSMDDFLDRHPGVAKSLEKKPNLLNDKGYLKHHKDLDEFLGEHPTVREEIRENPSYFMHREERFEASNMDREAPDRDRSRLRDDDDRNRRRDADRDADNDLNRKELQDMDRFLDKHKNIDKDLQKNPSLVNDNSYLKHHKPLQAFLGKNPQINDEFRENPTAFMRDEQRLERHRMNNHMPDEKANTKLEEKEKMNTATPH